MKISPAEPKSPEKKEYSIEEIMKSLKSAGDDVKKIVKLHAQEKVLVAEFLEVLKEVPEQMFSVGVSLSDLPFRTEAFSKAHVDSTGHLILTSEDGHMEVVDLGETKNRDLMMLVIGDIVPKFKDLASQMEQEKIPKPPPVQEIPPPEPVKPISLQEEVPVELPKVEISTVPEEVPVEITAPEVESVPEKVPVLPAVDEKPKLEDVVAETLEYLEMLGNEVFDQSPISVYFDDWLVNLRQVMLAFESNEAIHVDEIYTDESEQIYNDIEEELANRLLKEAEIEASTKTLTKNKYILREMDQDYAVQSNNLQVRGKSALDFLIRNVQRLEDEIAKAQDVKTLNFIRRIALKQKRYILTQRLKAAKHRLDLVMQSSAPKQERRENLDIYSAFQSRASKVNEKSSKGDLVEVVKRLEKELAELKQTKTSILKKLAQEQKISEITEKLNNTKELLELATQDSTVEQQRLREEYEKKKQATITKMPTLEKEIENKKTDGTIQVRKEAIKALTNAVNSLIQRQTQQTESST